MQQQNPLWYYVEDNLQTHMQSQKTVSKIHRRKKREAQFFPVPDLYFPAPFFTIFTQCKSSMETTELRYNFGNQILCVCRSKLPKTAQEEINDTYRWNLPLYEHGEGH